MKRTLMVALVGTAFLIPLEAEAQRHRPRNAPVQREALAVNSGRLAHCRAPANGRAYVCRNAGPSRVVYRYAGPRGRRVWVAPRWGRVDVFVPRHVVLHGDIPAPRLRDLVGRDLIRRVHDHGRDAGLRGPVRGQWRERGRLGAMLVLTMEGQEVARLIDFDHDRRMDELVIRNFRDDRRVW